MNSRTLFKNTRPGSVLPVVILVIVLLMAIGIGILGLSFHGQMFAIRSAADMTARCAADAAVADAVFQMNEKLKVKPWDDFSLPDAENMTLLNCDASFDYAVSKIDYVYTVDAQGTAVNSVRSINSTLRISSVFDYALFARDYLELKNSTQVNWVNNQSDDWPLQVGTNSIAPDAVTLLSGSKINGDVVVGVDGEPNVVIDRKSDVTITGDSYAMFSSVIFPRIDPPPSLVSLPSSGEIKTSTTISSSAKYKYINLSGFGEIITIDEPVKLYITGDITLGNSAQILIGGPTDTDNDASLTIYLGGNFEGKNGTRINNQTLDARRFTLYGLDSCTQVSLKNSGDFYGAIYAPNAALSLYNSSNTYGSLVAAQLILDNGGNFFYDVNLRDRSVDDDAVRFVVDRWSEQ
jgi:hypothetical protein